MPMWDNLWFNATIATCGVNSNDYGLLPKAALATLAGKIAWIGSMDELSAPLPSLAKQLHDCEQKTMTPGLIDCHTHLVYAGDRTTDFSLRLHGASYEELAKQGCGILSTVRATAEASPDSLYQQSAKRLQSMLQHGTTTVEIKSGYGLSCEHELKQLTTIQTLAENFPLTLYPTFLGAHALPQAYKQHPDDYIDYVIQETLPQVAEQHLAKAVDAFCETIAFTPAQVERFFTAAEHYGMKIKLHAEQLSDSQGAQLASRFRALSADHLEHATLEGLTAMATAGTIPVLLPGAFYFLREKKNPPIALLRELNLPIAIATDCNPGTSPATSLPLMMNMACVLWQLTPEEALRSVTINAAKALGLAQDIGSLETGKQADFVIWDVAHPDQLSYAIGGDWNKTVVKNGVTIFQTNS